jgi:hypothetical protein
MISDSHHSFQDLYRLGYLLFCHLLDQDTHAWKSWHNAQGTSRPGWFLTGTHVWCLTPATQGQSPLAYNQIEDISYYLPAAYWDLCHVAERPQAPAWDGHTSADVCDRLERALREEG